MSAWYWTVYEEYGTCTCTGWEVDLIGLHVWGNACTGWEVVS